MSDIFYREDNEEPKLKGARRPVGETDKLKQPETPPAGYIKVKLSSIGKLSVPRTLHVRDYSGENAWNLSLANSDTILDTVLTCLNDMIYEDIDPRELHENEIEEILFNVLLNFWTPILSEYPYPYEESELDSLPEDQQNAIREGTFKPTVDIDITKLKTKPLPKEFNEPIIWEDDSIKVGFILPRVGHYGVASEYIEQKYAEETEKFSQIEDDIEYNRRLSPGSKTSEREISNVYMKEYKEFLLKKNSDYLKAKHSMMLQSIDGKPLTDIESRIEAYSKVGLSIWSDVSELMENELDFGIVKDIEVVSPLTQETVVRRYQFRFRDVIPNPKHKKHRKSHIRFGD